MTAQEAIKILKEEKENACDIDIEPKYTRDCETAFDMAIAALEKQIPKRVINKNNKGTVGKCPVCHNDNYSYYSFCCSCGQALDWSDEE